MNKNKIRIITILLLSTFFFTSENESCAETIYNTAVIYSNPYSINIRNKAENHISDKKNPAIGFLAKYAVNSICSVTRIPELVYKIIKFKADKLCLLKIKSMGSLDDNWLPLKKSVICMDLRISLNIDKST